MAKELTQLDIDRIDYVDNTIWTMVVALVSPDIPDKAEWDMELIGEISELVEDWYVVNGFGTDGEFKPYITD